MTLTRKPLKKGQLREAFDRRIQRWANVMETAAYRRASSPLDTNTVERLINDQVEEDSQLAQEMFFRVPDELHRDVNFDTVKRLLRDGRVTILFPYRDERFSQHDRDEEHELVAKLRKAWGGDFGCVLTFQSCDLVRLRLNIAGRDW